MIVLDPSVPNITPKVGDYPCDQINVGVKILGIGFFVEAFVSFFAGDWICCYHSISGLGLLCVIKFWIICDRYICQICWFSTYHNMDLG